MIRVVRVISSRWRSTATLTCILSSLIALPAPAIGQASTASLAGTVIDESAAGIPDVEVLVVNVATGLQRQVKSGSKGTFSFAVLPAGRYRLSATRTGFAPTEVDDIVLGVGEALSIVIKLRVAGLEETVTVAARPAVTAFTNGGTVVRPELLTALPLNGRNLAAAVALSPGVVLTPSAFGNEGQFSVNGQRTASNAFSIDGVSANFGVSTGGSLDRSFAGSLPASNPLGTLNTTLPVDAIQEFRVSTSPFAPEYGRMPGAHVSLVTRAGSQRLTGTAFLYARNDGLTATNWFANRDGIEEPEFTQTDFGGTLGGRFPKTPILFFWSSEILRGATPRAALVTVPTSELRRTAPESLRPFVNAYPLPNRPTAADALFGSFASSFQVETAFDSHSVRIDWPTGHRSNIFGRFSHGPAEAVTRTPANPQFIETGAQTLTIGWNLVATSSTVVDARANWSRSEASTRNDLVAEAGAQQLTRAAMFSGLAVPSTAALAFRLSPAGDLFSITTADHSQTQLNVVATATWQVGRHSLKAGVDYRREHPEFGTREYQQTVRFNSVTSFQSGRADVFTVNFFSPSRASLSNLSVFVQDLWQVSRRLGLGYGIRVERNPAPKFDGVQPVALRKAGDQLALSNERDPLWNAVVGEVAPRLSVAYAVDDESTWMLRGGWGLFYDVGTQSVGRGVAAFNYPFATQGVFSGGPFPTTNPNVAIRPADDGVSNITSLGNFVHPDLEMPRIRQWSVGVERVLRLGSMEARYVGNRGQRLLRTEFVRRLDRFVNGATVTTNNGRSRYDGLQIEANLRAGGQVRAETKISYALGRATDDVSTESETRVRGELLPSDLALSAASFDVRHALSLGAVVGLDQLTGGWRFMNGTSLSAFYRFRTALPVNVTLNRDILGLGLSSAARPDAVPGADLYVDDPNAPGGRRINAAAFRDPPAGMQGNFARNGARGFAAGQLDVSLHRNVGLTHGWRLKIGAEIYNVTNTPQFGQPEGRLNNPLFGVPTRILSDELGGVGSGLGSSSLFFTGGPRTAQIVIRVTR